VFYVSIWGLGTLFGGGLSPQSARGDGTERTVDKSWRSCRSYYFSYKLLWKSAASEDIKVTL